MKRLTTAVASLAFLAFGAAASAPAYAHFKLVVPPPITASPQSWANEDAQGSPQLSAPCGQADPGDAAIPTNVVTTLKAGANVTIMFDETIFHPGHYRVALADTQADLPADPPVTAGDMPCGTTVVESTPTFPILGDGLADHTQAFTGTQTIQVPLPAGMTCTNCTLQITEFMGEHGLNVPGGCFYHHCMTVNITSAGPLDAGVPAGPDASTATTPDAGNPATGGTTGGGCDARASGAPTVFGAVGLMALVLLGLRRRR